jgi:hypothetical protein
VRKYFIVRVSRLCAGPFPGLTGGDRVKLVDPEAGPCLPSVKQRGLGRAGSGRCPLRNLAPERLRKGARQGDSRVKVEESIQAGLPSGLSLSK